MGNGNFDQGDACDCDDSYEPMSWREKLLFIGVIGIGCSAWGLLVRWVAEQ
jgi:hypothetical protein